MWRMLSEPAGSDPKKSAIKQTLDRSSVCLIFLSTTLWPGAYAASPAPSPTPPATTSPTSVGPTSPEEARLLLSDGNDAFEARNYEDAAVKLKRLVARYPGYPGYLPAHLTLGRALLALNRPEEAVAPLKYYVSASKTPKARGWGRVYLARAYLLTGKPREALSMSGEIEREKILPGGVGGAKTDAEAADLVAESLLIRARALMALERDAEALTAVTSARKLDPWRPGTRGESAGLELELVLRSCARMSTPGPLAEDQVRNQLERRGVCLSESLIPLRTIAETGDKTSLEEATKAELKAWENFSQACANPPKPPENLPDKKKKRTPEQLKEYFKELDQVLREDCRKRAASALGILAEWSYPTLEPLTTHLRKSSK